ncbi:MAG TPA: mobile mystery protein A [Solirubrobacteraceae bacterium]|jgi:predicted DNA-binding mobile mystery protein A|nr:mobile mystery protein A [Solirubrobacteraceae bacterium]
MQRGDKAAQARRELDRKFSAALLDPIAARPRSGWIRAIRGALGMTQAVLAERLGVSASAINQLERAELHGGITTAKLADVARALDCTLVYALVPNSTLEQTVNAQAQNTAAQTLGYAARTMALEDQAIDERPLTEAIHRYAQQLVASGNPWGVAQRRPPRET